MRVMTNCWGWGVVVVIVIGGLVGPVKGNPTVSSPLQHDPLSIQDALDNNSRPDAVLDLEQKFPVTRLQTFGRLPLSFEENHGQVDAQVKYLARGKGYTLFLTETEAVLSLQHSSALSPQVDSKDPSFSEMKSPLPTGERVRVRGHATKDHKAKGKGEASIIRMTFAGANHTPKVSGDDKLLGIVNYFIGKVPDKWRTKIPTYKKVQYDNLYDGIDLVYYGNQGQLEYDLVVAPGADPNQIQLAFEGTDNVTVDPNTGDLVLSLPRPFGGEDRGEGGSVRQVDVKHEAVGVKRKAKSESPLPSEERARVRGDASDLVNESTLRLLKPHVYQLVDGRKVEIAANYILSAKTKSASLFSLPTVETTHVSSPFKGEGWGEGKDHELPSVGIQLASFDTTKPVIIDPVLFFSSYIGTVLSDFGRSLDVDSAGAVFLTGSTSGPEFPGTAGSPIQNMGQGGGNTDVYVTKISQNGLAIEFSTYLGGSGIDEGIDIATDGEGAVYVTGSTTGENFPGTSSSLIQSIKPGPVGIDNPDGFITKINSLGTEIVYSSYLGTTSRDIANGIDVDKFGAAYITGQTEGDAFPGSQSSLIQTSNAGGWDVFLTKINPSGSAIIYSTYLGTPLQDIGKSIVVDATGAAYLVGDATAEFPGTGLSPIQNSIAGGIDAFVTKVNPEGTSIVYSTYLGTIGLDTATGVALDATSAAYVVGYSGGDGLPGTNLSPIQNFNAGGFDLFVTKINSAGTAIDYSTYIGTIGREESGGIAVDLAGAAYITGETDGANFPGASESTIQNSLAMGRDAVIAKLSADGSSLIFSTYLGGDGTDVGENVSVDKSGNVYVTGLTDTQGSGIPGTSLNSLQGTNAGGFDAFLAKICNDPPAGTSPGKWLPTTNTMSVVRRDGAAVLLPNGKVLVTGGLGASPGQVPQAEADLFDPATNSWTATTPMNAARHLHTATLLPNGTVLVAGGGAPASNLFTAEIYDPTTEIWTLLVGPNAEMTVGRQGHSAVLLADGRVLVAGGSSSDNQTELFDPATNTWSVNGTLGTTRVFATLTRLANGEALLAGGQDTAAGTTLLDSVERFDPTDLVTPWSTTGSLFLPHSKHGAVLLADGSVLVIGGNGASTLTERYDPSLGTWATTGSMQISRSGLGAALLADGRVLVAGGAQNAIDSETIELFDPTTGVNGAWALMRPMAEDRGLFTTTVLATGQVLVAGGANAGSGVINTAEVFTPNLCGPEADLSISVVDNPDPVIIGSTVVSQIDVTNHGPADLAVGDVVVTKQLPLGTAFNGAASSGVCTADTDLVTCEVGPLASGAPSAMVNIGLTVSGSPRILENPNEVNLVSKFDPDFGNNTVVLQTIVQSDATPETDLVLTITDNEDPVSLTPGTFRYDLTVDNMGEDVAIDTRVVVEIPPGVTFVNSTLGGACTGITTVTCLLGDVDVLAGFMFSLNVMATQAGSHVLSASATNDSSVPDVNPANSIDITETTSVGGTIFTVNTNDDVNDAVCDATHCSLRDAINAANGNAGLDVIAFDISTGGLQSIAVGNPTDGSNGPLPVMSDPVILDATTQPGFTGVPIIEVEGSQAGDSGGVGLATDDSVIRGFVINRFHVNGGPSSAIGINSQNHNNNLIENNYLGTDTTGNGTFSPTVNTTYGVIIGSGNSNNIVRNNVLSGNSFAGILIGSSLPGLASSNNVVVGNRIGLSATNDAPLPNASIGIHLRDNAQNNQIGTDADGVNDDQERNIISGNTGDGIRINIVDLTQGPTGNIIAGNFIGTNSAGTTDVPNANHGVFILNAAGNTIGGTGTNATNVISGNAQSGVVLEGNDASGNRVQGNYIGLNVLGAAPVPNLAHGVLIQDDAQSNTIGGSTAESGNVVSGNNQFGIRILDSPTGANVIQGNIVGLDATGTMADVDTDPTNGNEFGNEFGGIKVVNSSNNCIGGSAVGSPCTGPFIGNVIGGNGRPGAFARNLEIETSGGGSTSTNNSIQGNFIGLNISGTASMGQTNTASGIALDADVNSFVGGVEGTTPHIEGVQVGACTGACNLISGHRDAEGITLSPNSSGAIIQGNYIGTDITGTVTDPTPGSPGSGDEFGNDLEGIVVSLTTSNALIGGTSSAARNIIAGNGFNPTTPITKFNGIRIAGGTGHTIQGNYIGTDKTGLVSHGNFGSGVFVSGGGTNVTIGGTTDVTPGGNCTGACNLISGNILHGVMFDGSGTTVNFVEGNFIGTNVSGTGDLGNTLDGILISEADTNTIGGVAVEARNIISGNDRTGINLSGAGATNNTIQGNFIGTDRTGSNSVPNGDGVGVTAGATNNLIGGDVTGTRNVISGNTLNGVVFNPSAGTNNSVQGNYIGLTDSGDGMLANNNGILLSGTTGQVIGGITLLAGNVISGNTSEGISLLSAANHMIQGNFIGTDTAAAIDLGNGGAGIQLSTDATNNTIGGLGIGGNTIAFNATDGVVLLNVTGNVSNRILSNRIFLNGELGIDLGNNGVNNPQNPDPGSGPNGFQNFPVITSAVSDGGGTTITGSLNSTPGITFRVEFFSNAACDELGFGEGEAFLGSSSVLTNGSGNVSINVTFATIVPVGQVITSTATDLGGNTSEFSQCVNVVAAAPNNPPSITSTEVTTATEGLPYTYTVEATDPDVNDALFFMLDQGPAGMAIRPDTGKISWTPNDAQAQVGLHNVTARVSDRAVLVEGEVLVNGGFETDETTTPGGINIPNAPGDWVGDITALVTTQQGITPIEGTQMLQFIATNDLGASTNNGSELLQIIDLTPYAAEVATGQMVATVSGFFNRSDEDADAETDTVFAIQTFAFDGEPSNFPTVVAGGFDDSGFLGRADESFSSDAVNSTWEPLTVSIPIPPTATYLVVDYAAVEDVMNDDEGDVGPEFDGHYGDAFTVSLHTVGGMSDTQAFPITVENSITVNSTDDPGVGTCDVAECTLREAMTLSNDTPGTDTIIFAIDNDGFPGGIFPLQGGAHTIQPISALPTVTDSVIIDGTTEPDFVGTPVIELNGALAIPPIPNGLFITAGDSVVRGLVINRFADFGINLALSGSNIVRGNYLGTDIAGTAAETNGQSGIFVGDGSSLNVIGGTAGVSVNGPCTGDCNLISGNTNAGIQFGTSATNNTILGNYIGTKVNGTEPLGNGGNGIFVGSGSNDNRIGGVTAQERNVISGNNFGVSLSTVSGTQIYGNHIGTDSTGLQAVGNDLHGVSVNTNASGNFIGGPLEGEGNVISGNLQVGVSITNTSSGNFVQGNFIGTKASGIEALGNGSNGVGIDTGATNNMVGGNTEGARNVISGNVFSGIEIKGVGTTFNSVEGNYIGTTENGLSKLGNGSMGVALTVGASNNTIGGTAAGARNVLSGNGVYGVIVTDTDTQNNEVMGNIIGLNANEDGFLGNTCEGLVISDSAHDNTIGGAVAGARNLIMGNNQAGLVVIDGASFNTIQNNVLSDNGQNVSSCPGPSGQGIALIQGVGGNVTGNVVIGNLVGTDATGTIRRPNVQHGLSIQDAPGNIVGGVTAVDRNIISGNLLSGIHISGALSTNNVVQGNYIGTDITGGFSLANQAEGILVNSGVTNTIIGGTAVGAGNVISGNGSHGIGLAGSDHSVQANFIGTNVLGTTALPNGSGGFGLGIASTAVDIVIGGTTSAERNIISGNTNGGGVRIAFASGAEETRARIQGNFIGTDATGTQALGNGGGVFLISNNNTVGGLGIGEGNLISGNTSSGIVLQSNAMGNVIQGNGIGVAFNGAALGNSIAGISINGTAGPSNIIGPDNTIAFNGGVGVGVGTTNNRISDNSIFSNGALGIDLGGGVEDSFGVTANDSDGTDDDIGPNNLQNFPELLGVSDMGGATVVVGTLTSTPDTTFTVELYKNGTCDASEFGEGEQLVHTEQVTTDAVGSANEGTVNFEFTVTPAVATGFGLTATATDPQGNTSEFSNCLLYTVPLSVLEVRLVGNGIGTVTSTPVGLALAGMPGMACTGNQGAECRLVVPQNTVIDQLVAAPEGGTNFIGWSGDKCRGQAPCVFSVTAPRTIVGANFCPTVGACELPETPVGFSCESFWPNTITCSWQPVAETIGYRVLLGESSRDYTFTQDIGLVTSHTFTGLEPDVTYYKAVSSLTQPTSGSPLVEAALEEPEASPPSGEHIHTNVVEFAGDRWVSSDQVEGGVGGPATWEPDPMDEVVLSENSGIHDPSDPFGRGAIIQRPTVACRLNYGWKINIQPKSMNVVGGQGVIVRYQDPDNYYRIAVDWALGPTQPRLRFLKRTAGEFTSFRPDFDLSEEDDYHLTPDGMVFSKPLQVSVEGNLFNVFLEGLTPYSNEIDSAVHEGLGVGFAVWENGNNEFSQAAINYIGDPPPDCVPLVLVAEGTGTGKVTSAVVGQGVATATEAVALPATPQAAYPLDTIVRLTAEPDKPGAGAVEWRGCGPAVETPVMGSTLEVLMDQTQICQVRFPGTPTQLVTWDVDGNGVADMRDAGMLTRWAFGLRDAAMVEGLIEPTPDGRSSAGAIDTYLEAARLTMVDVDGDGVAGALTDTQIVTRFFQALAAQPTEAELRANSALIAGVVNPTPNGRTTLDAIVDHLLLHLPSGSGAVSALTAPPPEILEAPLAPLSDVESEEVSKPRKHKEKKNTRQKRRSRKAGQAR